MNKTIRILTCLLLLLGITAAGVLPAAAEEEEPETQYLSITSMEDFLEFADNCVRDIYSKNLHVTLKTDLDFTGMAFTAVPSFSGTFDGNRHTVRGILLETEGSAQGFFRYLTESALVMNLNLEGELLPTGTRCRTGGIAGENAGTIRSCKVKATVAGSESVGGIAGVNAVSGIIENCTVSGTVRGTHFAGGIVGENEGTVRSCRNLAGINLREEDNQIDSVRFDPDFLTGKEALETVTDLGGIAGTSSGVIRDCENHGNVGYPRMGYNIGGICGSHRGLIADCRNLGQIHGRKEIAGIAGQAEPIVDIDFTQDTLQILRQQLNTTSALANRASSNIKSNSEELQYDIESLHSSAEDAVDAAWILLKGETDPDTIIAAENTLSSSISSMQGSLHSINSTAQSVVGTAAADIRAINNSINAIAHTLDTAADNLGGTVTDISDLDTPENLTGKIVDCHNSGLISGDLNAGGIVGAAAWENDKDPEEDFQVSGDRSLNFDAKLRTVILRCTNSARVEVNKRNGGGIAGNVIIGMIKDCQNTGFIEGEDADYLGGIAGSSLGFLKSSNAKCKIHGHSFLGGIAGSASIMTDCRSTAMLEGDGEQLGSLLGIREEDRSEQEVPVSGNYYLPLADHLGAIDGIDYYGEADSLSRKEFLELPELSSIFRNATMTFRYPDGSTQKVTVPMGDVVPESRIPAPPRKDGYVSRWDLLEELDLNHMFFNVTLEAEYEPASLVLESVETRWDGKPVMLAEGSFGDRETMHVETARELPDGHGIQEGWLLPDFGTDKTTVVHLTVPRDMDPEQARVLIQGADGSWEQADCSTDGSYVVFSAQPEDRAAAVYASHSKEIAELISFAGGGLLLLLLVLFLMIRKKRKNKKKSA